MYKHNLKLSCWAFVMIAAFISILQKSTTEAGSPAKLPQEDGGTVLHPLTSRIWQELGCGKAVTPQMINVTCPPYQAIPNDDQDDSSAFQAAIHALPDTGGIILVPEGRYLFSKPLIIQKSIHLLGRGESTVLAHTSNLSTAGAANFIRIGGAPGETRDVLISHLTLEGRQAPGIRTPVIRVVDRVKGVKIQDVLFRNVSSTCILVFGVDIQDIHIYGNRALEFYEQFVELASGEIRGVYIAHNRAHATSGHPDLKSVEPFGIVFEPKKSGEISDVFIFDNEIVFEGMSKRELINTGGISLSVGSPAASYVYRNVYIMNNTIRRAGTGIRVQTLRTGDATVPGSVVVQGNYIDSMEADAIQITPAKDINHPDIVAVINNTVRGYSGHKMGFYDGIKVAGVAQFPQVRGNQILPGSRDKTGQGRYGISIGSGIRSVVVIDNTIADYGMGSLFDEGTSGYIQQNYVPQVPEQPTR
jgi:Pectate lyase superfamily protein